VVAYQMIDNRAAWAIITAAAHRWLAANDTRQLRRLTHLRRRRST
jgi:hypothetical protein